MRISQITFEFCIIQSDDRISITIVEKANQQLALTIQFNSTFVFLESCVRQSAFVPEKEKSLTLDSLSFVCFKFQSFKLLPSKNFEFLRLQNLKKKIEDGRDSI